MFLCSKCHAISGCNWPTFLESGSHGPCENCDQVAVCSDCHGYDFRRASVTSDTQDNDGLPGSAS